MKRSLARWLLAVLALGLAFGCAPSRTEEPGLRLWFPVDPNLDRTSSALDACPYDGEQTVPALLSALLAGPPAEEGDLVRFIPEGTRVLSWSLEDGVANVELSAAYAGLVGMELTLADCCITLGVPLLFLYVWFYVGKDEKKEGGNESPQLPPDDN